MVMEHEDDKFRQLIPGMILAGGLSRRMGQDKANTRLAGQTLLSHAISRLRPQTSTLLINSNTRHADGYGLPVIADTLPDYQGPLAGILAGLLFVAQHMPGVSHLLSVPVDCPFLPSDLACRLVAGVTEKDRVVVAEADGQLQPTVGLWPLSRIGDLEAYLANSSDRSIKGFLRQIGFSVVAFAETADANFSNINSPEELAQAERLLAAKMTPKIIGISGWKNSGKTGLAVRLVTELTARGYRVSTIKHAHHDFDIDKVGADSFRHRQAGAHEVTIVSGTRYAVMHELRGAPEPSFEEILARLAPCDLVLIEGYKREPIPKIEARRRDAAQTTPLAPTDPWICAIAADHPVHDTPLPVFDLDDTMCLADFAERVTGLSRR
jgi:molybdopterin-guanine dinucleotide biosynthesis protein MobB/molybdenum cofactor guanylyltransferase